MAMAPVTSVTSITKRFVAYLHLANPNEADRWKKVQSFHPSLESARAWATGYINIDGKRITNGILTNPQDQVAIFEIVEEFIEVIKLTANE